MKWKQRGKVYIAAAWVGGHPFVFVQTLQQGMLTGEVFPVPDPSLGRDFEAVCTTHGRDPAEVRKKLERWADDHNRAAVDRARFDYERLTGNELDGDGRGG